MAWTWSGWAVTGEAIDLHGEIGEMKPVTLDTAFEDQLGGCARLGNFPAPPRAAGGSPLVQTGDRVFDIRKPGTGKNEKGKVVSVREDARGDVARVDFDGWDRPELVPTRFLKVLF